MFSCTLKGHQNQITLFVDEINCRFPTVIFNRAESYDCDYTEWQQLNE